MPAAVIRPPRWARRAEASGALANTVQDAAAGLVTSTADAQGRVWAYVPEVARWEFLHVIKTGDWLYRLAGKYYGEQTRPYIDKIKNLARNAPIVGPAGDKAWPGDRIIIPGLADPGFPAPSHDEPIVNPVGPVGPIVPVVNPPGPLVVEEKKSMVPIVLGVGAAVGLVGLFIWIARKRKRKNPRRG